MQCKVEIHSFEYQVGILDSDDDNSIDMFLKKSATEVILAVLSYVFVFFTELSTSVGRISSRHEEMTPVLLFNALRL
jgi:hypothetical protein